MEPDNIVPIIASSDGFTAINQPSLFLGDSQEAENGSRERQFITPDRDFDSMDVEEGSTGNKKFAQPMRPAANMLHSKPSLTELAMRGSKRKNASADDSPGEVPLTKQMKRKKNDIDSLKAELEKLERIRDQARLKHEAEQQRTEDEAVSNEYLWLCDFVNVRYSVNWSVNGQTL